MQFTPDRYRTATDAGNELLNRGVTPQRAGINAPHMRRLVEGYFGHGFVPRTRTGRKHLIAFLLRTGTLAALKQTNPELDRNLFPGISDAAIDAHARTVLGAEEAVAAAFMIADSDQAMSRFQCVYEQLAPRPNRRRPEHSAMTTSDFREMALSLTVQRASIAERAAQEEQDATRPSGFDLFGLRALAA